MNKDDDNYKNCFKGCYHKLTASAAGPCSQPADPQIEESIKNNSPQILASMDKYLPCYKGKDGKMVAFRWCRAIFPWTPTNEERNFCYAT
jgi:hypothetical protein